jgi:hypothetical protein
MALSFDPRSRNPAADKLVDTALRDVKGTSLDAWLSVRRKFGVSVSLSEWLFWVSLGLAIEGRGPEVMALKPDVLGLLDKGPAEGNPEMDLSPPAALAASSAENASL